MSSRLIYNIRQLVGARADTAPLRGAALAQLPIIDNSWIHVEGDRIAAFGRMRALPPDLALLTGGPEGIDATGSFVLPAWCDSHTHLVFAGSREAEFVDKLKGLSYAEINAKGGGILNSARRLADTPEDRLFTTAWQRLEERARPGTRALEIKTGKSQKVEGEGEKTR